MKTGLAHEQELLQRLIEGETEAFRRIYEFYQGRIFVLALRFTKSRDKAEEITQEVFIRIWEKRQNIQPDNNFSAYLSTIARNHILLHLKMAARDKALLEKIYRNMQVLKEPEARDMIEQELKRLYDQAIDQLSPSRKKVFLLSREEELSYDQIAEKLGISKNTVRNQMSEALQSIREYLANHPDFKLLVLAILYNMKKYF